MGRTGIIRRDTTVKDTTVEEGMTVEIIASREQCDSGILFYGYGVLEPGGHTQPHVHDNCEIAWFLEEGSALWAMGSVERRRRGPRGLRANQRRLRSSGRTTHAVQSQRKPSGRCSSWPTSASTTPKMPAAGRWRTRPEVMLPQLHRRPSDVTLQVAVPARDVGASAPGTAPEDRLRLRGDSGLPVDVRLRERGPQWPPSRIASVT